MAFVKMFFRAIISRAMWFCKTNTEYRNLVLNQLLENYFQVQSYYCTAAPVVLYL